MLSANGVLFQSVIDLDGSAVQILDDIATDGISGICIESVGNDWTGDIAHEDYQRPMRLALTGSTLTGAIKAPGIGEWLSLWADYADVHYSLDPATGLYVNDADPTDTCESYRIQDPNNMYAWATGVKEYSAVRGVYLTMDADSVWHVTGASNLRSLTVEPGAVIDGVVTVDGAAVDISAGGSWTGDIAVTPAGSGVTWADYQAWLISILPDICPDPEGVTPLIQALTGWDDIDFSGGPWEKIFGEQYFGCTTWEEFQANGGVGAFNDYEDLPS